MVTGASPPIGTSSTWRIVGAPELPSRAGSAPVSAPDRRVIGKLGRGDSDQRLALDGQDRGVELRMDRNGDPRRRRDGAVDDHALGRVLGQVDAVGGHRRPLHLPRRGGPGRIFERAKLPAGNPEIVAAMTAKLLEECLLVRGHEQEDVGRAILAADDDADALRDQPDSGGDRVRLRLGNPEYGRADLMLEAAELPARGCRGERADELLHGRVRVLLPGDDDRLVPDRNSSCGIRLSLGAKCGSEREQKQHQ